MNVAVRLEGIEVAAGGRTILGPLDLELNAGEYVLLVGPSGSGKSTLLRAIAGLATPVRGSVQILGEVASRPGKLVVPPAKRGVGFVFQGAALWPHMSVERTLNFTLGCAGIPRGARKSRIQELLDAVELSGFDGRLPGTLSGGERQRLALARAIAVSPRLLLLDEPLGALDHELRDRLVQTLAKLHSDLQCTTLHVTHDPDEARSVADRVIRLSGGQLVSNSAVKDPE